MMEKELKHLDGQHLTRTAGRGDLLANEAELLGYPVKLLLDRLQHVMRGNEGINTCRRTAIGADFPTAPGVGWQAAKAVSR